MSLIVRKRFSASDWLFSAGAVNAGKFDVGMFGNKIAFNGNLYFFQGNCVYYVKGECIGFEVLECIYEHDAEFQCIVGGASNGIVAVVDCYGTVIVVRDLACYKITSTEEFVEASWVTAEINGGFLAVAHGLSNNVIIYDLLTLKPLKTIPTLFNTTCVRFKENTIGVAENHLVSLFDTRSNKYFQRLELSKNKVYTFDTNDNTLGSCGEHIHFYDVRTWRVTNAINALKYEITQSLFCDELFYVWSNTDSEFGFLNSGNLVKLSRDRRETDLFSFDKDKVRGDSRWVGFVSNGVNSGKETGFYGLTSKMSLYDILNCYDHRRYKFDDQLKG